MCYVVNTQQIPIFYLLVEWERERGEKEKKNNMNEQKKGRRVKRGIRPSFVWKVKGAKPSVHTNCTNICVSSHFS